MKSTHQTDSVSHAASDTPQIDKFKDAARELGTDEREDAFDRIVKKVATAQPSGAKICPECGHEFRGNGWDGIDAHWKSKHEHLMPYSEAWPLIKAETYSR